MNWRLYLLYIIAFPVCAHATGSSWEEFEKDFQLVHNFFTQEPEFTDARVRSFKSIGGDDTITSYQIELENKSGCWIYTKSVLHQTKYMGLWTSRSLDPRFEMRACE